MDFTFDSHLIRLAVKIVIAAIGLLLLWMTRRGQRKQLDDLSVQLGGGPVSGEGGPGQSLPLFDDGVERRVRLEPGSWRSNLAPALILEQMVPLGFQVKIERRIPWYKRQAFLWDRLRPLALGDSAFDQAYQVRASDREPAIAFLNHFGRREAVDYFFQKGFNQIWADPEGVRAKKTGYKDEDLNPGQIQEYFNQLRHFVN